jgi:hypothetical protein
MNYGKIYNQIIERAKNRVLKSYSERHHIKPKSIGGTNDKDNIVRLTAKEHFICHLLLVEMYPESSRLKYALWAMANQKNSKQDRTYKVGSRLYERLRKEHSERVTKSNTGREVSIQTRKKLSEKLKNRKVPQEQIERSAKARTGQKRGQYRPKELKFEHKCKGCECTYRSADVKGTFCKTCKEPRACKCGCGRTVKTPGKEYYPGCKLKGKTYLEIYNTATPNCGFKKKINCKK